MSRNEVRIYRSRRPVRTALLILAAAAAVVVILAFAVFFGFRRYIVYTSDGVRLEIPWLEEPSPGEDEPPLDYGSQPDSPDPEDDLPGDNTPEGAQ